MTEHADPNQHRDQVLLDAIVAFTLEHAHPDVQRFGDAVANWGNRWCSVEPTRLPATTYLEQAVVLANPSTRPLIELFLAQRARLRWEQSYRRGDGLVGDDMLSGYCFAEIVGARGPFVSDRVRGGLGVWGPSITYPIHWHEAEEIYVVMGGSADFSVGGQTRPSGPGDVVYVNPGVPHGFTTASEPLAVFYLWQAGPLRERPSFAG